MDDLDALFDNDEPEVKEPYVTLTLNKKRSFTKRWLVKLPGFMSVDSEPYTRDGLEDDLIEIEDNRQGLAERVDGYVKLTTRIRVNGGGQSNCRLLQWSDGSMTMAIGRDQFEVQAQPMRPVDLKLGNELQGSVSNRMALRPFIMSDQSHRRYNMTDESIAQSAVKMAVTMVDPEAEKQRMIKAEQEKIKSRRRLEAKQKQQMQKHRTRLSASFLEEGLHGAEEAEEEEADEEDADFINDEEEDVSDDDEKEDVSDDDEKKDDDSSDDASEEDSDEDSEEMKKKKRKRIIEED